jgi:cytochrome c oxidase subunit 2
MLNPNSPQAQIIANLFWWSMAIAAVIFALVTGLVLWVAVRYRGRAGQGEPRQVAGNTRLEIAWTAGPTVLLAALFGATLIAMGWLDPEVRQQPDVVVTGYQWWWKVEYPKSGVVTANEIHMPVGKQVLFRLEANDVIHDFWVPELGPKRDMIPGDHTNTIWLAADKPGVYHGACAEFCGVQHAWMRILVVAESQADFDAWQQRQLQAAAPPATGPAPVPATADVARGAGLFRQLTCVNCHAVTGAAGAAGVGPNLAHLGSRLTLGAGRLPNTTENLAAWIANPKAFKPGVYMPGYELPPEDLRALVAYLESLK